MLGFQRFQVFIELVLIENCGILKIGKRYDHDDGGASNALWQEEKGRPEGLLKHGRHVAGPGHTRRLPQNGRLAQMARAVVSQVQVLDLPQEAGSLPDDVSVAQFLTEKDNAR